MLIKTQPRYTKFFDPSLGHSPYESRLTRPFRNPMLGAMAAVSTQLGITMAAGKWKIYDVAKLWLSDGTFDLDLNTNWNVALCSSTSNANTLSLASPIYANLTNELTTANGYTVGGVAVTPTWTQSGGTATFDSTDPQWTASGGSITARFAVLYKNATVNTIVKPLMCVCLLDTTPADVTATTGNTFTIVMNASGLWAASGAATD